MAKRSKDPEYYIDAVGEQIDIYNGSEAFLESYSSVEQPAGKLYAAHFAQSEICNGGFRQLFKNSTGVLSPEAVQGFQLVGMPRTAELLVAAMQTLGDPYPRDQTERRTHLEIVSEETLRALDKQFFVEIENEASGFYSAICTFNQASE